MRIEIRNLRRTLLWTGGGLAATLVVAAGFPVPATFKATVGPSVVAGVGGTAGSGAMSAASATSLGAGQTITVMITNYSPKEEIQALADAPDGKALLKTLSGYSHGTVTIGNKSFEINAASSRQVGSKYSISVLTAKPLEASRSALSASGATAGLIHLTVATDGKGIGSMYTATGVKVSVDGAFNVYGGAATATELVKVMKQ